MKARGLLLAFCAVSAAIRAEEPDWFDAFRGRAFLQGDVSFVAREKTAPRDAPPVLRARWVVLRYAGFTEKERRFWPSRNILLVALPSGTRYVLESSFGFVDEGHLEEERPWQRVASARTAFEVWMSGADPPSTNAADAQPCDGMRERVRAPGGTLEFFVDDLGSRTVRASLAEIAAGTFDEDERRDLGALLKVSVDSNHTMGTEMPTYHLRDPLFAVNVALRDQVLPPDRRTVVLAPDPAAPVDLSSWRALAHLPLDLPPFPPLPAEGGFR
ncbi:MAG: hypothetical protein NEA02_16365 [Thermoanaerobaculia bacterium]|nr:hypothetical protein [Thermoanaerobaculia bacterium]